MHIEENHIYENLRKFPIPLYLFESGKSTVEPINKELNK